VRRPVEQRGEGGPVLGGDLVVAELADRLLGQVDEPVAVEIVDRGADDPQVAEQAGIVQVEQAGQELAAGQVTGRPVEDDRRRVAHTPRVANASSGSEAAAS
jgi:hypothetical protein